MDIADEELLAAIRAGDDDALGALLARHAPAIYRFGVKMCRDSEDAKDVLQDTLLAAARGIREFRGASSLSTWLFTVARSFCIKKRRTSKFAPAEIVSLDDHASTLEARATQKAPDEAALDHELSTLLDSAIASLDPGSREVLVLRDIEGLTAPEVAEVLGVSVDAVKSRLHRARAEVRAKIEARLPPDERVSQRRASSACPDIAPLFSRFLEGEIGAAECAAMQAHVSTCARCDAACASLKRTLALCRAEPRGQVPPDVQELVRKALRDLTAQATRARAIRSG
jgi:RNA polymerase sigma-70 factor (ECF subfamily)